MNIEKMNEFFSARLAGYEDHQLLEIERASTFYPYTAALLPKAEGKRILDLGCGTGLEMDDYYAQGGKGKFTGIDLTEEMLDALRKKKYSKNVELINGNFFDVPFGGEYDAAVSVEAMYHFTYEQKVVLYRKVFESLKTGGVFVVTDFCAENEEQEQKNFEEFSKIRSENNLSDKPGLYHFDTPLTMLNEVRVLFDAGFVDINPRKLFGQTMVLCARTTDSSLETDENMIKRFV